MPDQPQGCIDLHTHSDYSDGRLSPEELIEEATWKGLSAIALTDHDSVAGNETAMAAGKERGLEVISGTELSCEMDGLEVHIVGLCLEPTDELRQRCHAMRVARESRMEEMLGRLGELGIEVTMAEIPQTSGRSIGRPHLAQALVEKGVVRTIGEAFARYIGDDGPANVPKMRFGIQEAVDLIHSCKGVAILAHPGLTKVFEQLPLFLDFGIDGMEAYYPKHTAEMTQEIVDFCGRHDLVISGGSDYHGNGSGPDLGVPEIPYSVLEHIRERAAQAGR